MTINQFVKMSYDELTNEIIRTKKKIKNAQDTIKLLEKLQVAEEAKMEKQNQNNYDNGNDQYGNY